jgi:hypothetical protein
MKVVIRNLRILLLTLIHQILMMTGMPGVAAKRKRNPNQPKGQENELSQNHHLVVTVTATRERVLNLKKVNIWGFLGMSLVISLFVGL